MNLYLISQSVNSGYDTYDSAVVVATNELEASMIHPNRWNEFTYIDGKGWYDNDDLMDNDYDYPDYSWANHPEEVTVEYLGQAHYKLDTTKVVCASFNAG